MLIINEQTEHLILPRHVERVGNDNVPFVDVGGHRRYCALKPQPVEAYAKFCKPFRSAFKIIDRAEWPERIKEQKAKRRRISDYQKFKPYDQDGLPSCWRNGSAAAASTARVIAGMPYVQISSNSLCPEISYRSGGYEGDSAKALVDYGGVSVDLWPNNDTTRRTGPEIDANRELHKVEGDIFYIDGDAEERFAQYATATLMTLPMSLAFNRWSHVIMGGDLKQLGQNLFGGFNRNNWGSWGDKNDYGYDGYVTHQEGAWTPSSGVVFFTPGYSQST